MRNKGAHFNHPERKPDEMFFGNVTHSAFICMGWKTKRLGQGFEDGLGDGNDATIYPLFVNVNEAYEYGLIAIAMAPIASLPTK